MRALFILFIALAMIFTSSMSFAEKKGNKGASSTAREHANENASFLREEAKKKAKKKEKTAVVKEKKVKKQKKEKRPKKEK